MPCIHKTKTKTPFLSPPFVPIFSVFIILSFPRPSPFRQSHLPCCNLPLLFSTRSLSLLVAVFAMEDYKKYQIPAFGYWDFSEDLPITQYFESARHAGLIRYSAGDGERDLYGDDLKMTNVNVMVATTVSRPKMKGSLKPYQEEPAEEHVKEQKKIGRVCDVTEPPRKARAPKAVDEDLYKIPPELLHEKPKRKRTLGFFSRCLVLSCIA